jgi:hypothetical protein
MGSATDDTAFGIISVSREQAKIGPESSWVVALALNKTPRRPNVSALKIPLGILFSYFIFFSIRNVISGESGSKIGKFLNSH